VRDCERGVEDRNETLAFVKRQKLLKPPLGPVPILAEPSAV